MNTSRLFKGLGTAGLGIAVTAAFLQFGIGDPPPAPPGAEAPDPEVEVEADPAIVAGGAERVAFPPGSEVASLPELASRTGLETELDRPLEAWRRAWTEGVALAPGVYDRAATLLVARLSPDAVAEHLSGVRRAVEEARLFDARYLPGPVVRGVELADSLEIEGRAALDDGQAVVALAHGLRAADALRAMEPAALAEQLTGRAEDALQRIRDGSPYSERLARRGERLAVGARDALDDGAWDRAIERAYYACQLLEGGAEVADD